MPSRSSWCGRLSWQNQRMPLHGASESYDASLPKLLLTPTAVLASAQPKPESLWWASIHQAKKIETLRVGNRGVAWDLPVKACLQFSDIVSTATRRVSRCRPHVVQRHGRLVARQIHLQEVYHVREFSATCMVLPLTAASIGCGVSPCWPRCAHGRQNKSTLHSPS